MDIDVRRAAVMTRPLRKDAAGRLKALLVAPRVVATEVINAPVDRITERAGIGLGALYRNFPGRTEIALPVLLADGAAAEARGAVRLSPCGSEKWRARNDSNVRPSDS